MQDPIVMMIILAAFFGILLLVALFFRLGKKENTVLTVRFEELIRNFEKMEKTLREELTTNRLELATQNKTIREEVREQLTRQESQMENLRNLLDKKLTHLQEENERKLEQMRQTVDEKLQGTLEKRLGESFQLVSERLEQVHRGLGEMQKLASGVDDLKRVLTNIKTRGTWGEVQLANLLEQILTPEQFGKDVCPKPGSREKVEFAIKLPARDEEGKFIWLPIDAKFPKEVYERLVDAAERADSEALEKAAKTLENQIRDYAKAIRDKYICPPYTTDFAILFLPTEGLYSEILRRPGLADWLQRECKILIAGPMTLSALLNSLQVGFRTLAIQKRSSEVWKILASVQTEFSKFVELLDKVKRKIDETSNTIEQATNQSKKLEKKLRDVEMLPEMSQLLPQKEDAAQSDGN